METLANFIDLLISAVKDVVPIILVIVFFQLAVIRQKMENAGRLVYGFCLVILGLAVFSMGLEKGLFPLGEAMISQLTDIEFLVKGDKAVMESIVKTGTINPQLYLWTYVFAFFIGFSTTLAEPALIAVAMKAQEISLGAISAWGLRIAVALGVAFGVTLGCHRIVIGAALHWYIIAGYILVIIQTYVAPKMIIPLAYDSGGVTTSTVTVPLVAALGIGLATKVPGRSVLIDAFGLIAFASLFPIVAVLGYAILAEWAGKRKERKKT